MNQLLDFSKVLRVILLILFVVFLISLLPIRSKAPLVDVVYVDPAQAPGGDGSSWEDAFNDLQIAIDSSPSDSEFWCARGELGMVEIDKPARLFGGFAGTEAAREERDWSWNKSFIASLWSSSDVSADGFEIGGEIFMEGENVGLRNCRFAVLTSSTPLVRFVNCLDPFIENTYITGCRLEAPAVEFFNCREASIVSCTFADNVLSEAIQSVIKFRFTSGEIYNTILWDPGFVEIEIGWGSNVSIDYSDVRGGCIGEGNISEDPLFTADYHLRPQSPCRDQGVPECGLELDWDKEERPFGSDFDIGADECIEVSRIGKSLTSKVPME